MMGVRARVGRLAVRQKWLRRPAAFYALPAFADPPSLPS